MGTLIALAIGARERIWYEIKPWPRWWKLLTAILVGTFVTAVLVWAAGLEYLFFQIFNIEFPS